MKTYAVTRSHVRSAVSSLLCMLLALLGVCLMSACKSETEAPVSVDEATAGETLGGTPIAKRTDHCFPAEPRDLFWQMDQVASGPNGELQPLDFDVNGDGAIDDKERDAIRGRNTWLLWGGGNEVFWGWLQQNGYGLTDFLVLMDSRERGTRFKRAGVINQPGFRSVTDPDERILGLWLDLPKKNDPEAVYIKPPGHDENYMETKDAYDRPVSPAVGYVRPPEGHPTQIFEPGDKELYNKVIKRLPQDGLDVDVYGYPSGIFGLRLMPNPDFFGNTDDAAEAREYWDERVVKRGDSFYSERTTHSDPKLIRPFRVSMSCGFCHVGPHPLLPPADPENPEWYNLSSFIGAQYWDPQPAFANLLNRDDFLHHFLRSQQPGAIDTSLVSTDHINNPNTINAVFDIPARLERALANSTEHQSPDNLLIPSIEDGPGVKDRHFPRVLLDGADSVGAFGAFIRVPLNIGTFSEQWKNCHNPLIGFKHQRPFRVEVCQENSVHWRVNQRDRVPYTAAFFTHAKEATASSLHQVATEPMKLKTAVDPDGEVSDAAIEYLAKDTPEQRIRGREIWVKNCAVCHSSKQPDGFEIDFDIEQKIEDWASIEAPEQGHPYPMPARFSDWPDFTKSPAYEHYLEEIDELIKADEAGGDVTLATDPLEKDHPYWVNNFLSSEIRIPVTLIGTNSARAMATNGMKGQVWDNFSSEDYKKLPSVGEIPFYNPFSDRPVDKFGNNDTYTDGREFGGPGYYRPATHISLWAQGPFLHNNSLGIYNQDPSVQGRIDSFDDGMRKLLWLEKRGQTPVEYRRPGDLRGVSGITAAANDPGFIYRTPVDTQIEFQPGYIRPLITGIVGKGVVSFLSTWLWVILTLLFVAGLVFGRPRHAGVIVVLLGVLLAAAVALTAYGHPSAAVMMACTTGSLLILKPWFGIPLALLLVAAGSLLILRKHKHNDEDVAEEKEGKKDVYGLVARGIFVVLLLVSVIGGIKVHRFIDGKSGPLSVGPIPQGTPVSLLMNMDPEKKDKLPAAALGLTRAMVKIKQDGLTGADAYKVFEEEAGPQLLEASKCPDMVMDKGHWFGMHLSDEDKEALIAFLKTL